MGQQPQASCSHPGASITKQFELVPPKAGALTVAPYDAPAPCPWSRSVCWCLAEGYRIGDQHYPVNPVPKVLAGRKGTSPFSWESSGRERKDEACG